MGFFDELEDEVQPDYTQLKLNRGDYEPVFAQLESGWKFEDKHTKPGADRKERIEETCTISAEHAHFVYQVRVVVCRGKEQMEETSNDRRVLDRDGLVELLNDQPRLGQAALKAVGVDTTRKMF